jgi:RNA polymerase sigma-70 factor, ECF subfamily
MPQGADGLALSQAEFNRLVTDHGPALYRIAYRLVGDRHEAEDLVQDTYRSAWKSRQTYQAERGERAWLAAILRRRAIDRWRRHTVPTYTSGDGPLQVGTPAIDPTDEQFTDEMQHALGQLPQELRETLLLVVVTELTHQEAADVLGVPLGTVLSRVSRARARLRELLLAVVR